MPITVNYNPAASSVGQAGLGGGFGDYAKWLFEQQQQAALQQQAMANQYAIQTRGQNLDRMNAISQAALQQWNGAANRQFDWANNRQSAQERLGQMQAGAGYDQQQMQQRGELADRFDQRRQERETDLLNQRGALSQAAQQATFQQQEKVAEVAAKWKAFADPFTSYGKQVASMQQQGLQYAPEQQTELQGVQKQIAGVKQAYAGGKLTRVDALNAFQPLHERMMSILPSQPKPDLQADLTSNVLTHPDFPGVAWTKDPKGQWKAEVQPKAAGAGTGKESNPNVDKLKGQEQFFKADLARTRSLEARVRSRENQGMESTPAAWQEAESNMPQVDNPFQEEGQPTLGSPAPIDVHGGGMSPQSPPPEPQMGMNPQQQQAPPQEQQQPQVNNPARPMIEQKFAGQPDKIEAASLLSDLQLQFGPDPKQWPKELAPAVEHAVQTLKSESKPPETADAGATARSMGRW